MNLYTIMRFTSDPIQIIRPLSTNSKRPTHTSCFSRTTSRKLVFRHFFIALFGLMEADQETPKAGLGSRFDDGQTI
jgi:hypothetical protein